MRTPSRFAGLTSSEMETPGFGELGERTCGYFYVLWICLIIAVEKFADIFRYYGYMPFDNGTREICRFAPTSQRKVTFQSNIF